MNVPVFTSAFAPELAAYVAFKTDMGCYGTSRIWYLKQFDAYCTTHGRSVFDRDTVEGWMRARLPHSGRYRSWMSYIRDFGRWLRAHGRPDAYVLSSQWKAPFVPAHPYLLSSNEIDRFFTAAAALQVDSPWRWQAMAFFTLMHSCGIRTGEARTLRTEQVDLHSGHVDILWSKGRRSRRLPLSSPVTEILARCDRTAREHLTARGTFFVTGTGGVLTAAAVGVVFNRIWDQAELARPDGGTRPRPYDFRHHFAYANIERWMTQGVDVAAMLPYLARYMGHASLDSTYYYVHTSPDFMDGYAVITQASHDLLPEVGFA